jgi:hypothetical protein
MASSATVDKGHPPPKQGEKFRCNSCGMELTITKECPCPDTERVHFHCCGREMEKA